MLWCVLSYALSGVEAFVLMPVGNHYVGLCVKTSVFTEQGNDVVNGHYSRKLLKMDILRFETC